MRLVLALSLLFAFGCASTPPPKAEEQPAPAPAAQPAPAPAAEPAPAPKTVEVKHAPKAPVALEEYFKIRRIGSRGGILLSFSHDEKRVAYLSDEGGRTDIWVQPIEGGAATQITHVSGFILSFAFSPTEDKLVYEADVGGDELPHLFLTDSKGTAPKDLTADYPAGRRTGFWDWADDGKTFLYVSSLRDEKYLDLMEYDVKTGKSERLWEASGSFELTSVSRDHRRFVINETVSDADNNLYLVERGPKGKPAGKPVLLTRHTGEVLTAAYAFSKDAKTLFVATDEGREFAALYAMDLKTLTRKPATQTSWDVDAAGFTHAFKYFYVTTNEDGQLKLDLEDAKTHAKVALPAPPAGCAWVPLTSSKTDRYLGVRLQGDTTPAAPYVIDLQKNTARKVIEPLPATLADRTMAVGESVRIKSFDDREVPAFLYKPEGPGPFPAIIEVHGGPTAQSMREFSGLRQYWVSKGYVLLVPNVRGSTGYGKTYTKLDNLDLGGGPLKDVVACKQWLVKQANVDEEKVVVFGGSYGGYMALAAATFTPEEFGALIDYCGVSDLKSLVESFPAYWASGANYIHKKFGDPKNPEHAAYQHDRSPLHFTDKIVKPLLVIQGDRDPRVKKDQSDRMVSAIEARKVPVHYLVVKDEGHGFSKTENIVTAYSTADRFLDRYIFEDTSVEVLPAPAK
ncbi:MAG: S9 family peptidase [Myxococcales bacterium]